MIAILALIGTSDEVATQLEEQCALIDRWGWGHGLILKLTVALDETSADLLQMATFEEIGKEREGWPRGRTRQKN